MAIPERLRTRWRIPRMARRLWRAHLTEDRGPDAAPDKVVHACGGPHGYSRMRTRGARTSAGGDRLRTQILRAADPRAGARFPWGAMDCGEPTSRRTRAQTLPPQGYSPGGGWPARLLTMQPRGARTSAGGDGLRARILRPMWHVRARFCVAILLLPWRRSRQSDSTSKHQQQQQRQHGTR